ncbi:MAG: sigma-54 dependent transcriptional regulator [Bacteroidales bacterium]|nr:sigma-54 dependent transcriptional regulator [Bacteroidales bacterium]
MESTGTVLIVDDNQSVLDSLELFLKHKFQKVICVKNPNIIPPSIRDHNPDIVLLDMNFTAGVNSGNEGFYWMQRIKKMDPAVEIILITAYGDVELAVRAMKEGATDFILKPWNNNKLLATLQTALKLKRSREAIKKLEKKNLSLREKISQDVGSFIGKSPAIVNLFRNINKIAKTDANILITGENGTGKELVAFEVHRQSRRKNEVFIKVDIGSLNESIFESELFGHKKGAFTDAKESRTGKFETASKGTLMLDEIGNLSVTQQNKLLTVLQSKKVTPLGSNREIEIDFRLICATNRDLEELAGNHLFREDLFYRINTITLHIPPLRERMDDLPLLMEHFLKIYTARYDRTNLKISSGALDSLMSHNWPGNVRELKHTIENAVIMCGSEIIKPEDLQLRSGKIESVEEKKIMTLEEGEKLIIGQALINNRGKIVDTARELKIGRQTLYRKMKKYNLIIRS